MTQKKLKFMNVNNEEILSRNEMKYIIAGSGACKLAIRNPDGSFGYWTDRNYSVGQAQHHYGCGSGTQYGSGHYVSGYCCASC